MIVANGKCVLALFLPIASRPVSPTFANFYYMFLSTLYAFTCSGSLSLSYLLRETIMGHVFLGL